MTRRVPIDMQFAKRRVTFDLLVDNLSIADNNTLHYFEMNGYCEPEVAQLMARVVREGDRVIDIGANIGFFTMLLARLVGQTGSVIAFEPFAASAVKLRDNAKANQIKNVFVCAQAVSDKTKNAKFYVDADSGRNSLAQTPHSVGTQTLVTTTLDEAISFDSCRLIKMDVEGSEVDVAAGAGRLFNPARTPFIVSELNEEALDYMGTTSTRLREWMRTIGYDTFLLHPDGALPTLLPPKTRIGGDMLNINVLFSTIDAVGEAWDEVVLCV